MKSMSNQSCTYLIRNSGGRETFLMIVTDVKQYNRHGGPV